MWVAQKVICIFYHLRFGTSALFSAKAMTSCKLANTKYATTEQQAPCHLPGTKPSPPPPADLSPRARHSLTALLLCSERPDALRLLPSNFPFFFQFSAKNILAIRCSSETNENSQARVCLTFCPLPPSVGDSSDDTRAPVPGVRERLAFARLFAVHLVVTGPPAPTFLRGAVLQGAFGHLSSVSASEQGVPRETSLGNKRRVKNF